MVTGKVLRSGGAVPADVPPPTVEQLVAVRPSCPAPARKHAWIDE
ncbi:hypothetical protein [Amycolatopsis sp. Hca4]|nr:hypothetical protein [Amycolatopsis sp. Hca4]